MSRRRGRSFFILDNGMGSFLRLLPIIPRGYIFVRGNKLLYGGTVFSLPRAIQHLESIERHLKNRRREHGSDKFGFDEITVYEDPILPIEPPPGTLTSTIPKDDASASEEDIVFPMLPPVAPATELKAETLEQQVVVTSAQPEEKKNEPTKE